MDKTRIPDIEVIERGLKNRDPNIRSAAINAGNKIRAESYDVRIKEMRRRMVEETRKGKNANANDIREDIQKHTSRGYGKTSFTFSGLDKIFKK